MDTLFIHGPVIKCIIEQLDYSDLISMMYLNKRISKIVKKHIENLPSYYILTIQKEDGYMEEYKRKFYNSLKEVTLSVPTRCKFCIDENYNSLVCTCKYTYISIDQIKILKDDRNNMDTIFDDYPDKIGNYMERNIWSSDETMVPTYNRKSLRYLFYGIPAIPDTIKHRVPAKYIDAYNIVKYDKIYNEYGSIFKNLYHYKHVDENTLYIFELQESKGSGTTEHLDYICMGEIRVWEMGKVRVKRYIIAKGEYIREYMYKGTEWILGKLQL